MAGVHANESREGERRHVTVLFADVSGFTAMARAMDPEDVTDMMNACFGILERAVLDHGGHVDKYIGDCVMALFGAPVAIEDAPRQAVNAAISILEQIADFARSRGMTDRIDVHVGINTGLVVYGDVGGDSTRDTTAMGDTVNLASRLGDAAGAQRIYVGAQTRHETAADFRYRRLTGLRLKGVDGKFEAWELLSRQPQRHRSIAGETGRGSLSALVGRDAALLELDHAIEGLEGGRGAIVAVTGEAGLGKSRLLLEMRRRPRLADATCLQGRAFRLGDSPGLAEFADMLRSWGDLAGGAGMPEGLEAREAALRNVLGDRAREAYPFLANLAGMPLRPEDAERLEGIDGEGMQRLLTRSIRELFGKMAADRPLVVMFDDLHWADQSTLDLLGRILDLVENHAILFVVAFRPDADLPSMPFLEAVRAGFPGYLVEIALDPLDAKDSSTLLRQRIRFDDRPDQTRRTILSHAEGNPFFIEEIIRALIDVGAIQDGSDGLRVTERIADVKVPGTVQELVMDRVDRLPSEVREVLQAASVLGRTFPRRILETLVPHREALDEALAHLVERGFLERPAPGDEGTLSFTHALAHETVYEAILRRKRREMHRAVGLSFESVFADRLQDHHASLAYHFTRAEDWAKASHYLLLAGDEASHSAASSEALRYFAEAAEIHDRLHGADERVEERAAIEKKIGLAFLNKGDLPEALDHLDHALAMLGHTTPQTRPKVAWRLAADLLSIAGHLYLRRSATRRPPPPPRVVDITEICFHKGKAQSTTAPQGYVLSMLPAIRAVGAWDFRGVPHACGVYSAGAALFAWSGLSFPLARRMLTSGGNLVTSVPDAVIHGTMKFVVHYLAGDWDERHELPAALVEDGLRHGAFWEVNTYLGMLCERRIQQGRLEEAAFGIDRIASIGERYGYEFSQTNVWAMRTFLLFQAGRLESAQAAASRYYVVSHEEALNLLALATRARILIAAGDLEAAAAPLRQAEELASILGRQAAPYHLAPMRLARLEYDVRRLETAAQGRDGDLRALRGRARKSRREAWKGVTAIARDRPACRRAIARLEWNLGRPKQAMRWWQSAMREAGKLGALPELARACRESAQFLLAAGRGEARLDDCNAADLIERASAIEARLEAEWSGVAGRTSLETPEA